MKYLILSKRSRALFGIGIVAISIGLISKKVINYPAGGCMKGTQEITFNICLLYTSPSPRDKRQSRMPSSA